MKMTNDETLAIQRGQAMFVADVGRVVATIAERHRATGAPLTWQLVREIREEALADIGLAGRWPAQVLDELCSIDLAPPLDGPLRQQDLATLGELGRPIANVFRDTIPALGTPAPADRQAM
ncbi:hypothetical protein PQR05_30155 [Paraburkholderia sediminicola]|uniref:DUF2471 family protein n=1 Tax=Paraburkholderia sediminicola TaxID=458836 RepID=UPI0038BCEFCA